MNEIEQQWMRRVGIAEGGCWLWLGTSNGTPERYPVLKLNRRVFRAHRLSHEFFIGPIPEGYVIDHLCRVPMCVNPLHLEAVPHRENVRRGKAPAARNVPKVCCPRGHSYDYTAPDGRRRCLTCDRARERARRRAA